MVARTLGARSPTPVELEALPVPTNHGLAVDTVTCFGPDEDQGRSPTVPESGEPDPEDSIGWSEPRALLHFPVDSELLSEGEVLEDELTLALEE